MKKRRAQLKAFRATFQDANEDTKDVTVAAQSMAHAARKAVAAADIAGAEVIKIELTPEVVV